MKQSVTHYSGDRLGGASRAALRLHSAFCQYPIVNSNMIVAEKKSDDYKIIGLSNGIHGQLSAIIKSTIDAIPRRLARPLDNMPRSAGWAGRLTARDIDSHPSDIAHLHWINGGFISVEEIGKITKPLVWTFHDMWPFCGAEHLAPDVPNARWKLGYPDSIECNVFDLDRWVWLRKKANWKNHINIVTPSQWLADCVRQSALMHHFQVDVIPNTLDVNVYKPLAKPEARDLLNLPKDKKLVLFGAIKGTQLPYKGWDLLKPALREVFQKYPESDAVIFGQSQPEETVEFDYNVHWMGHLYDDYTLAALYSAADVLVIPSRQESFGQIGSEAQACGCPVVAFDSTGLKDVVVNDETGLLVKPYDAAELASAIIAILTNDELRRNYSISARKRAQRLWSYSTVAEQYKYVYEKAACK